MTLDDDDLKDLALGAAAMLRQLATRWQTRVTAGRLQRHAPAQCLELVDRLDRAAKLLEEGDGVRTESVSRRTENALAVSEERFRLLVDSVQDYAIFMLDADGRVASWNAGAERIKGYRAEEILGKHFSTFYPAAEVARGHPDDELRIAARDGRYGEEGWRIRKDGTRFWAAVVITAVRDATGALRGFAKVTRDLTERKLAEDDRVRLAKAHEAVRLRDEFLSIASHELRTPLTAMRLQLDSLADSLRNAVASGLEEAKRFETKAHKAQRNAGRLINLVDALLDLSRLTSGKLDLAPEPLDFSALIREAVDDLRTEAANTGSTFELALPAEAPGVWDRVRLEQIVTNLVSNAVKFGQGHPIDIALAIHGDRVKLTVHDRGIGIAPEDAERIFQRFERGVSARHYGGLGLGLFLTRMYVELHGGSIRVSSTQGQGATFEVDLPVAPATHETTKAPPERAVG